MKLLLMWLALVALLAACTGTPGGNDPPATAESAGMPSLTADGRGVIFTADQAEQFVFGSFFPNEIQAYWTPAQADVTALETALIAYLPQAVTLSRPLSDYYRQYAGLVLDGRREIYANYFCNAHDIAWQIDLVEVADGGDCYFTIQYNPEAGTFSHLSVHGES